jgi:hypothetical protein
MSRSDAAATDVRILSAAYILALALLLANDHILKYAYAGVLTGKLSDFAGLFAFGVFVSATSPRNARALCCGIALLFAAWKSPLSQPAIELWNAAFAQRIDRVVDYSDLIAIAVLPIAARSAETARRAASHRPAVLFIAVVSLFAFAGTSLVRYSADVPSDPASRLIAEARSAEQLAAKLESCGYRAHLFSIPTEEGRETFITVSMRTLTTKPTRDITLHGSVGLANGGVTIEFDTVDIFRQTKPIVVHPYVAEAIGRIRDCLAKGNTGTSTQAPN